MVQMNLSLYIDTQKVQKIYVDIQAPPLTGGLSCSGQSGRSTELGWGVLPWY